MNHKHLVADANGIIFAERIYKCIKCYFIDSDVESVNNHYWDHTGNTGTTGHHPMESSTQTSNQDMMEDAEAHATSGSKDDAPKQQASGSKRSSGAKRKLFTPVDDPKADDDMTQDEDESQVDIENKSDNRKPHVKMICSICSESKRLKMRYGIEFCENCYRKYRKFCNHPQNLSCDTLGLCHGDPDAKYCRVCWFKDCFDKISKLPLIPASDLPIIKDYYPTMGGGDKNSDPKATDAKVKAKKTKRKTGADGTPLTGPKKELLDQFLEDVKQGLPKIKRMAHSSMSL